MVNLLVKNRFFLPLIYVPLILSLAGLIFIFEASAVKATSLFNDSFHFFKAQLLWLLIGINLMVVFSLIDYRKIHLIALISLIVTFILLVIVLIPGIGLQAGGARRWLDLGFFNLQPTELAKFSVIVYLSCWFSRKAKRVFFSYVVLISLLISLIVLQPDVGTAVIVFLISMIIYYQAGMSLGNFVSLVILGVAGFFLLIKSAPYRLNRLIAFVDPSIDPLGIGYHINQIKISLSQGGLFGQGFGISRQKYFFLPEAHTDSIFAIIGEEYGFFGVLVVIFLYLIFVYRIYHLVRLTPDILAKLLATGIFAFFNLQITINLGGVVGLFPLTGVPLPFISYGGSHLVISYVLLGILLSIEKRVKVS